MVNCNIKSVTLEIQKWKKLKWKVIYKSKKAKIISSIRAKNLIGQSCLTYFAHIRDVEVETPSTKSISVVYNLEKSFLSNSVVCLRIGI